MADPYLGQINMYGFNFAVRGWAFCAAQLLPIAQNTALFSLLGTAYGGDGRTTFGLPDMRGRVPVSWTGGTGPGLSAYRWGQKGGVEDVTLNVTNLPSHNHTVVTTINATNKPSEASVTPNSTLAATATAADNASLRTFTPMNSATATSTVSNTGSNNSFDIRQPYETVSFQIAMQGIFPSRS